MLGDFAASEFSDGHDDVLGILSGRKGERRESLKAVDSPLTRPLANMTLSLPANERYTRTQDGDALASEHILVNQPLLDSSKLRVELARINADFGQDNQGDASVPVRVSDRDPMVLYIGGE